MHQYLTPSGNCLTVTIGIANQWKKLGNQWCINQCLYTQASWQHWYSPRTFELIHLIAISIRLRSIYVLHMPFGNIKTVTFKINLYSKWLSEYGYTCDTYATPSGNINIGPRNINPHAQWLSRHIRPVAITTQFLKL